MDMMLSEGKQLILENPKQKYPPAVCLGIKEGVFTRIWHRKVLKYYQSLIPPHIKPEGQVWLSTPEEIAGFIKNLNDPKFSIELKEYICIFDTISRRIILSIFMLAILCTGVLNSRELIVIKSGYKEAINYMRHNKGEKHLSTMSLISAFYTGVENVKEIPESEDQLKELAREGYNYLLVDYHKYHYIKHEKYNYLGKIEMESQAVLEVPNKQGRFAPFLYEDSYGPSAEGVPALLKDETMGVIKIYDLHQYLRESSQHEKV